ncbi:MAG: Hpt domain-containing protein [Magnetococcales bacterium]|nr:Hpt domain-containing protein [Magnetococcales bacterium]
MVEETDRIVVYPDEDLEDIVPGYLKNRHTEIPELRKALADRDFDTLRMLSHRMKGSGAGYGFDGITDIGREMELAAANNDSAGIEEQIAALENYLSRVDVVFV